jgi:hypothetical protein
MNDVFARSREYVAFPSAVGKVLGVSPIEVNSSRSGALTPQPHNHKMHRKDANVEEHFIKRVVWNLKE